MADDFRTTEVGERYAQALFDLALETGRLDAVRADVLSLKAAWTESADLRRLATSPVIAADDQAKGLVAIAAKAKFEKNTANFLGLLAQNGRARDLPVGGVVAKSHDPRSPPTRHGHSLLSPPSPPTDPRHFNGKPASESGTNRPGVRRCQTSTASGP